MKFVDFMADSRDFYTGLIDPVHKFEQHPVLFRGESAADDLGGPFLDVFPVRDHRRSSVREFQMDRPPVRPIIFPGEQSALFQ